MATKPRFKADGILSLRTMATSVATTELVYIFSYETTEMD